MRASVHLVVIGLLTGCLLSGCGGSARPTASYLNMRYLAASFRGQLFPALHRSPLNGGPYESSPSGVSCKKTGSLEAACVLTFWPVRYSASGYEYRYVKQGPSQFKITVKIAPDGRSLEPSVPQREGSAE
jgi:hypothetical protein